MVVGELTSEAAAALSLATQKRWGSHEEVSFRIASPSLVPTPLLRVLFPRLVCKRRAVHCAKSRSDRQPERKA